MHSPDQAFIVLAIVDIDEMLLPQEAADHLYNDHGIIGFAPVFANHDDAQEFAPGVSVIELQEDGKTAAQA